MFVIPVMLLILVDVHRVVLVVLFFFTSVLGQARRGVGLHYRYHHPWWAVRKKMNNRKTLSVGRYVGRIGRFFWWLYRDKVEGSTVVQWECTAMHHRICDCTVEVMIRVYARDVPACPRRRESRRISNSQISDGCSFAAAAVGGSSNLPHKPKHQL